ncbi:hypothetical protein VNO78_28528 [Psophocarpus tetragonolobus]|uniref:Polygalacturonase n=1 Tax=Psophocarpus tetragonolobus TaxID=3891 RepID=A0AAN9S1J8_PSOTE
MKGVFVVLLVFVTVSRSFFGRASPSPCFNVASYGARGNGKTDDSEAFLKAWKDVCNATQETATLVIPKLKTFMLQPILFQGPCKPSTINIELQGSMIAPKSVNSWKWRNSDRKWVQFSNINGLVINGEGQIDGQGHPWWNSNVSNRPPVLQFHSCGNLSLNGTTHINSPKNHISIDMCNGVHISNIHIIAPMHSPNTDGIDIAGSSNVLIKNSTIETGDDCIAINSGSSLINISGIFCGPGHGISIGSLGQNGDEARVEEVHVRNCTLNGTLNGVRIKTWMGGSGYARKITFEDIVVVGVNQPVVINQHYTGIEEKSGGEAVKISDVTYSNVKGTASSVEGVILNCDAKVGCTHIVLEDIHITRDDGDKTHASCTNSHGICKHCDPIVPCLLPS